MPKQFVRGRISSREPRFQKRLDRGFELKGEISEIAESAADQRAGQHIAQEMHAEENPRGRDTESAETEADGQVRIEKRKRNRHGESRHGVSGWEGELIWRKQCRPAVAFNLAGPPAPCDPLQPEEEKDTQNR